MQTKREKNTSIIALGFLLAIGAFAAPLYSAQMGERDVSTLSFAEKLAIAQKRSLSDHSNNSRWSPAAYTSSSRADRDKQQRASTRRTTQSQQPRFTEDDLQDYSRQSPVASRQQPTPPAVALIATKNPNLPKSSCWTILP